MLANTPMPNKIQIPLLNHTPVVERDLPTAPILTALLGRPLSKVDRKGCQNGTFCVRDASTKGDYTLTIRFGERNKLIKIFVSGGRCGFAPEELKFDTVVQLIDYYKRNSLKEYNRQLEIELLYPLRRPNIEKTMWEIDGVHSVEHLLCQLRGLHAARTRILRFDDQISAELDSLREELQRKRQARAAFSAAHALFVNQMELITKNKELLKSEADIAHLNINIELQQRRLESIRSQQEQMNEQIAAIEAHIKESEQSHSELTPKLSKLHTELNQCEFRLCQMNVPQATVERERQEVSFLTDAEPEPLSRILMHFHLRWQPDRFLSVDCSKENGMKIVRALMDCNPNNSDGIFVIRPSSSQAGHYALTISNDNRIYNCLIEHRDVKHPESCGYAFLNTKLFFPTLVDFVRYYSHCSMKEHNSQLDTRLKIPAFKGTL
ncbi:Phosphatidylinositol 3-kinase regulatory subunit alpha [Toxocara canis]|uniref:Phosphatidylinositol 3-kinase regulatory subunit alpha n=1 Tax=Toxocara canis TaxID=6265 RepID=A0A0B2UIC9_TOXCA|nr:Phosphatidylinositol 3-kinase regulatory subunit alpha [Toxocara canis]